MKLLLFTNQSLSNLIIYRQAFAANNIVQIELANAEFEELIKKYPDCSDTYGLYAQVS